MLPFAYYILKVIICSAVLFGYYWFFLRNKVFHSYNRFYLLAAIVLSLGLPLLKFNVWQTADAPKTSVVRILQVVNSSDAYMDDIIVRSSYDHISKEQVAGWVFIAISLVMAFLFARTLIRIAVLKRDHPVQHYNDISLVNTSDKSTPFSFFKNIFWNDAIDINSMNGRRILKHEVAHVQEKHSHDKLFLNIVLILFWCNPIFWLMRKELNMIHEFIADKKAVEDGDTAAFAAMILQATYPAHRFELVNNFFYSPIKRRLAMLTKNKTKVNYISRLLVLPLAVLVFAAFSLKTKTHIPALPNDKQITVVIDAGHGGTDAGGKALDGTWEKDINLDLAKMIRSLNMDKNIHIVLTRETDIYQSPKEKAAVGKKMNADLFISIHTDQAAPEAGENRSGMSVFVARNTFENTENSKMFASAVINIFQKNYGLSIVPNPQQRNLGIKVLQENVCPSVLLEAGYISNKKDLSYLKSKAGREQFARNVLSAIASFAVNRTSGQQAGLQPADTIPEKKSIPGEGLAGRVSNFELKFDGDRSPIGKALIIINGKEYNNDELKGKTVKCATGKFYPKNHPGMLAKYGTKAANGVYVFDNASILPTVQKTDLDAYRITAEMDSMYYGIDASQQTPQVEDARRFSNDNIKGVVIRGTQKIPPVMYVIDGIVVEENGLQNISPDDVAEINIKKDADAVNKYGSKAVNGVVEIRTKNRSNHSGDFVIASPNGNALYIGVDNTIKIKVPATNGKISVTISQGDIRESNGNYIVRVQRTGETVINVYSDGKLLGSRVFQAILKVDPSIKGVGEIREVRPV